MSTTDNTKYFELMQMIFLLGSSKKDSIVEKHKFMTLMFFLKNPLFLEKLCSIYRPQELGSLKIKDEEKFNLIYEEERISLWSSKNDLLLSYLLSRELISVGVDDKGYSFSLTSDKGWGVFNSLKVDSSLEIEYKRADVLNKILGTKSFSEIKEIILEKFKELAL